VQAGAADAAKELGAKYNVDVELLGTTDPEIVAGMRHQSIFRMNEFTAPAPGNPGAG